MLDCHVEKYMTECKGSVIVCVSDLVFRHAPVCAEDLDFSPNKQIYILIMHDSPTNYIITILSSNQIHVYLRNIKV